MTGRYDEGYYRILLEEAQKGIESGKSFLEAIRQSEAALNSVTIRKLAETATAHLVRLEDETDQLWDQFKRILKTD